MNSTLIILGIILLIVIYILYKVVSEKGKVVTTKVDLSDSNGTVSYKDLSQPNSSRYCFSLWLYVESLKSTGNTSIIKITTDTGGTNEFFHLFVDNTAKLQYNILNQDDTLVNNVISDNFPIQKWSCIMISFDSRIVDIYMDGKMVKSQQLEIVPKSTDENFTISYGNCSGGSCKAYVAKFERFPTPMNPATAWSKYMEGNGGNYFSKLLSSYGATFTLTKDDLDMKQFTLF